MTKIIVSRQIKLPWRKYVQTLYWCVVQRGMVYCSSVAYIDTFEMPFTEDQSDCVPTAENTVDNGAYESWW